MTQKLEGFIQGVKGNWTVNYAGTQRFVVFKTLGTLINHDWLVQTDSVQTLQPIVFIYRSNSFVYCPLFYPLISKPFI